jgi:drug/metabolite transporter (DMT)-like permease
VTSAYLQLGLAMALVGASVPVGKALLAFWPVLLLATLRYLIAGAVLWPWVLAHGHAVPRLDTRGWWLLALQAFFGLFCFNLLLLEGLQRTSAVEAGIITCALPAVLALLARPMLGERLGGREWLAVLLATVGLGALQFEIADTGNGSAYGNALIFGAVVSEALFTLFARRLGDRIDPIVMTAWTNLIGLAMFVPLAVSEAFDASWRAVPAWAWALLLGYALLGSILSFVLWYRGVRRVRAGIAGVFTGVMPVTAVIAASLALGERFGLGHALGLMILLASLGVATLRSHPAAARSAGRDP